MRSQAFGEYFEKLLEGKNSRALPVHGHWDITSRCNLNCVHCNCGKKAKGPWVSSRQAVSLVGELAKAGCLTLILSGGEPLLHPQLREIYACARSRGILVILFTNATLVDESWAAWLKDNPPLMIEVTLHSLREEVFERISRVKGSFKSCMRGIDLLVRYGLPLTIKTVGMKENRDEIHAIKEFALNAKHAQFKFDSFVLPVLHRPALAQELRLCAEEVVAIERTDRHMAGQWQEYLAGQECFDEQREGANSCDAGRSFFYISPQLRLGLCNLMAEPSFDLRRGGFREGFFSFLQDVRSLTQHRPSSCAHCEAAVFCGQCPARAYREGGDTRERVEYLCRLANKRKEIFLD